MKANRTFQSSRSPNGQIHSIGRWPRPTGCLLDRNDRIWVGFDHGEWGGDLAIFDTRTGQFLTPDLGNFAISLFPIASIFQDSAAVYLSAGLTHLGMSTGCIVRFDQPLKATTLFTSSSEWEKPDTTKRRSTQHLLPGEFIGPAAYNSASQSIYYFAQTGIHVGRLGQNLADAKNWPIVAKPELTWVNGRSNAVGPPMTVLKILPLTANTFLLLTQNNGLLYFNGTQFSPCP